MVVPAQGKDQSMACTGKREKREEGWAYNVLGGSESNAKAVWSEHKAHALVTLVSSHGRVIGDVPTLRILLAKASIVQLEDSFHCEARMSHLEVGMEDNDRHWQCAVETVLLDVHDAVMGQQGRYELLVGGRILDAPELQAATRGGCKQGSQA